MDVKSGQGDKPMNTEESVEESQKFTFKALNTVRKWGVLAAFFGATSVAMGAFAAHGLKAIMNGYQLNIIAKAAQYQMYHALAMLGITIFMVTCIHSKQYSDLFVRRLNQVNLSFALGILMFSGSLYALAFTQIKVFAFLTPIGGVLFMFAWIWLMFAFYQQGKQ